MNILVTGGLGYAGVSLVPTLHNNENIDKIVIYDNLSNSNYNLFFHAQNLNAKVKYVEGNILDNRTIKDVISENEIDTIVHLAAKTTNPMSDHSFHEFDQVNHWGTSILTDAILQSPSVSSIVFLSSFSVYGAHKEIFDENDSTIPISNYGKSKLLAEKELLMRLPDRINKTILRSGILFGVSPGYQPTTVLNKYMFSAHYNRKIQIFGDGHQKRPFLHVMRLAGIINEAIKKKETQHEVYNIYDYNLSVNELADTIRELYADVDFIYMNRDHQMKSIQLDTKSGLKNELKIKAADNIKTILQNDFQRFSF